MKLLSGISVVLVIAVVVGGGLMGCGQKAGESIPPESGAPLPEWAPKDPSPEFLRGARVLKPIPAELLVHLASIPAAAATFARYTKTLTPAYEFFGALSNEQIERFLSVHEVRVPVKSMTPAQRSALDRYFEAWRKAGPLFDVEDILVELYRDGAREDLSNVEVGFVSSADGVNMQFWITRPDGTMATPSNMVGVL